MTTITIFTLFFLAVLIFAIINLFLWFLEFTAATIKYMVNYFLSKPRNWRKSYFDIRILFTKLLLVFSFAMVSPRTMVKYKSYLKRRHQRHSNHKS